ncbi:uncharacterized protein ACBR49_007377 isoform 2-T2 [Aulostomus maculatus]
MSQSDNPRDSQALLQSMLQRLKLQPGRERQACLHTDGPTATMWGKDGASGASELHKLNSISTNGVPSAVDGSFGHKEGEKLQPVHSGDQDSGHISFPSQKDNSDTDRGEKTVSGISLMGTGQLFPVELQNNADSPSSERTDREIQEATGSLRNIVGYKDTAIGQDQDQNQGFRPRIYEWSLKTTDPDTEGQEKKVLHVGNGGSLAQTKDMQMVPMSQNTASNMFRRKQRSSENKTRRWTQKIKERWMDRRGSLSKKVKEEDRLEQTNEQISPQNQLLAPDNLINSSSKAGEKTAPSLNSTDPTETPASHSEDATGDTHIRSVGDFEFGLGSFSLLEEIVTGQEWAKFLNPTAASERALSRPPVTPNPRDGRDSSLIVSRAGSLNHQWSFRGSESSPASNIGRERVSMDVTEGKQAEDVHGDRSEPMEDGQSNMQCEEREPGRHPRTYYDVERADILENSTLRSGAYLNRKRHYQGRVEELRTNQTRYVNAAETGGSSTGIHAMDETGDLHQYNVSPSVAIDSSPLSPSLSSPCVPAPRGVLKHSISHDSEASIEMLTKRRRVEANRRVHFSEEVVTIPPVELDPNATDSEEVSLEENDSLLEQESEVDPEAMEESAPARRPALPAWIRALKRKNTGRKYR